MILQVCCLSYIKIYLSIFSSYTQNIDVSYLDYKETTRYNNQTTIQF
jgi:hypothetical protein